MEYLKYIDSFKINPIKIEPATYSDLEFWQRTNQKLETAQSKSWNWTKEIFALYKIAKLTNQKPEIIKITSNHQILGLMLMVNNLRTYNKQGQKENNSFIWYLQSANNEYLSVINMNKKQFDISIGKALIDSAIVQTVKHKNKQLILHADPHANFDLNSYYQKQGFSNIDETIQKISLLRKNDGNYFEMGREKQISILQQNRDTIKQSFNVPQSEKSLLIIDSDIKETILEQIKKGKVDNSTLQQLLDLDIVSQDEINQTTTQSNTELNKNNNIRRR